MAASGEKPYRVYKGGRTKGKVPLRGDRAAEDRKTYRSGGGGGNGRQVARRPSSRWTWKRWTWVTLLALFVLLVIWSVAGYLAVSSGVSDANKRLQGNAIPVLKKQNSLLISSATNILLLGTDHSTNGQAGRSSDQHSDSMMLLRTDPSRHRLIYLSVPRDLRASIPGYGAQKVNAAMQIGGPKLAIQTADGLFGPELQVNHVVVIDMASFVQLIDAVGGIDVNVPEKILSNRFDCPYTGSRCSSWQGWRFAKGVQHMNGHRALIYSRIRENRLNPADSDISRGQHQQQVMQAALSKLSSIGTFFRLPFSGGNLLKPLATDLSTMQFLQLGWVKFRAGSTLHCRLGGRTYSGSSDIIGDQENIAVIQMVLGNSAAQPPPPGSGLYGAGCVTGNQAFP
jgi:polyisoprenyl-teichoic acid--peptidoglycan teichoic acid transferase